MSNQTVNVDAFIREHAALGWTRSMVADHLGINHTKMRAIAEAMPDVVWPARNTGLRHKAYHEERRTGGSHQ